MENTAISVDQIFLLAGTLFSIGLVGVMVRRDILYILMSLEIIINSAGLAFVGAGAHWNQADGQIMFIMLLTLAAAEVSVGLALILQIHRRYQTLDIDLLREMRG